MVAVGTGGGCLDRFFFHLSFLISHLFFLLSGS